MQPYQTQYVENAREIVQLIDWFRDAPADFEGWYAIRRQAEARAAALRRENDALLSERLFPALDDLHNASPEDIRDLEAFGDQLMDWSVNLDPGVYVVIHDALLSLYRLRRDRAGIIRELYKLGMGMYYQDRLIYPITDESARAFRFQNEMVFTEGGSYIRYFADLGDEETRGYVLRSLANISICCKDLHRRIAISARILQIVQDDYYRSLAPGLPWDVFLRRTHQQMSSNRNELSRDVLTKSELAAVLESCHEVFKPEEGVENPNMRWLWPYYDMEYCCGFVDLNTTLGRLENLIRQTPEGLYDVSGLYGCVQLPLYYARLIKNNPGMQHRAEHVAFLKEAYGKMMRCLMHYPLDQRNDFFTHILSLVIGDYYETEGVPTYREITEQVMRRFTGTLYVRSRRAGDMLRCFCETILTADPSFFDDMPEVGPLADPDQKKKAALDFAGACGLYHDLGLVAMNVERLRQTRSYFEAEYQRVQLHAVFGRDELKKRPSTAAFSDVAWGHHRWYNGSDGYPDTYVRNRSPYRQMTDVVAVVAYLLDHGQDGFDAAVQGAQSLAHRRFSPLVTAYLQDQILTARLKQIAQSDGKEYYREVFEQK